MTNEGGDEAKDGVAGDREPEGEAHPGRYADEDVTTRSGSGPGERTRSGSTREGESPNEEGILAHGVRSQIATILETYPGLNNEQLAQAVGVDASLALFHLDKLEGAGVIVRRESPRGNETICFHEDDAHLWENEHTRILYGHEATARIAAEIVQTDKCTTVEIANAVGKSQTAVRYQLKILQLHELARSQRLGRKVWYGPTHHLLDWWEKVGEDLMERIGDERTLALD